MAANKPHAEPQKWSQEDLAELCRLYPVTSIHDLMARFNRTSTSINKAASRFGLHKAEAWKLKECSRYALANKLREIGRSFYIEEFSESEQRTLRAMAHQGEIKGKGYSLISGRDRPVRMYVASKEILTIEKEIVYTWCDALTTFMKEMWPLPTCGTARIIKQSM